MPLPDAPTQSTRGTRHHQLNIRLSDDELEKIQARAEAHSRDLPDYVRRVAIGQIPALRAGFTKGSSV